MFFLRIEKFVSYRPF